MGSEKMKIYAIRKRKLMHGKAIVITDVFSSLLDAWVNRFFYRHLLGWYCSEPIEFELDENKWRHFDEY